MADESSNSGQRRDVRGPDHAESRRGHPARFRPGYGSGDAVCRRDREKESCDSEGLPGVVRDSRLEDLEAAAKVLQGKKVADGVQFYLAAASRAVQEEAEKRGVWQTLLDAGAHPLPSGCGPCI